MTEQEEVRYKALTEMFNSKGWKEYQEDLELELKNAINTATDQCPDNSTWQMRRGLIDTLRRMRGYESWINIQMDAAEEGDLYAEV